MNDQTYVLWEVVAEFPRAESGVSMVDPHRILISNVWTERGYIEWEICRLYGMDRYGTLSSQSTHYVLTLGILVLTFFILSVRIGIGTERWWIGIRSGTVSDNDPNDKGDGPYTETAE